MSARLRARATMAKSVALAGRSRPDWAPPRAARQFRSLLDGPVMNFLGVRSSRRTPSALRARAPGRRQKARRSRPPGRPPTGAGQGRGRSGAPARCVDRARRAGADTAHPRLEGCRGSTRRRRSRWRAAPARRRSGGTPRTPPSPRSTPRSPWRCAPRRARREPVDDTAPRSRPRPAASRDRARSIDRSTTDVATKQT